MNVFPFLRLGRLARIAAAIGWSTLCLKLFLSIQDAMADGDGWSYGLVMYLGYFTILTNWLATLALTAHSQSSRSAFWRFWVKPSVVTAIASAIIVVSIVYVVVLRPIWNPQGLSRLTDIGFHYVIPFLFVLYWWMAVPRKAISWRQIPTWLIYPLVYLIYILIRGKILGIYPYPFVDVNKLGYGKALLNSGMILLFFVAIALGLVWLNSRKPEAMLPPAAKF